MAVNIQLRRGTAAEWTSSNPTLTEGEVGVETDTKKLKVGDGLTVWASLPYINLTPAAAASIYAPIANPTFTGTVSGVTKSMVGLGSVDNTTDANKPVSTATQTALDLKLASATAASTYAPLASPTFTGTVSGVTKSHVGLGNVDNTTDANKPVSTAQQTALDLKAPLSSPDLTGTPTAPTATAGTATTQIATTSFVGTAVSNLVASAPGALDTLNELATALGNDASFSTTVTNALAAKAPLASPTFTGTVSLDTGVSLVFEGATANSFETTLAVEDPTADRTITFPDATGTVALVEAINTSLGSYVETADIGGVSGVAGLDASKNLIVPGASIIIEGATDNTFETTLTVTDPTADRTLTLPNETGTLATQEWSNSTGLNHTSATTNVHGIADAAQLATKQYADTAAGGAVATAATDATSKANAAKSGAESTAASALSSHESDTTNIHGITDTSLLTTTTNVQTLTNKTLTAPKINEDVALTATSTTLNYVATATSDIQTQLNNKQAVVANVSDTEIGYLDGVTSAIQTQINTKQPIVANVSDVEIGYLDGVTSSIQTQLDNKSTASKTETLTNKTLTSPVINTPTGITKTDVGLANIDNTADASKPVSTAQQTALDLKANLSGATFTGAVSGTSLTLSGDLTVNGTTTTLNSTSISVDDKNIELGSVASPSDVTADGGGITLKGATDKTFNWVDATDSWTSSEHIDLASGKNLKVNGTAVISSTAGGFIFTDGTQTLEGVPSRTPIIQKTASYTLSALTERDNLIEVASGSATTITIPLNSAVAFPVGTSIDILQTSTGQVTIAGDAGVTVNSTPGLKLRTQWSSATLFKRATNTWVVFGDLTA